MYVTRPRTFYNYSPHAIHQPAPEGPNSGYLVINRENETVNVKDLPLPQDRIICAKYDAGDSTKSAHILFIPVIDQPISSNHYYMISAEDEHQGLAYMSSTEEDAETTCCSTYITAKKPRSLKPRDPFQQFEVTLTGSSTHPFRAMSIASGGIVPGFLGKQWKLYVPSVKQQSLSAITEEAEGLNVELRRTLPDFNFPLLTECTKPVVVGKWICPFMFIREGTRKERLKNSPFYVMTLELRWERVFLCENTYGTSSVAVNVVVPTEVVWVGGKEAVVERDDTERVVWFWSIDDQMQPMKVGLSFAIIERMTLEEEKAGWVQGNEKQVMIGKVETFTQGEFPSCSWMGHGCYVLVESFVLRRMDGSLVLVYDFKNTRQIYCKWE